MAGIRIHQYPLERTSIGDEDYYDIDYWTGSSYQTAKIKGSTLKNVLGKDFIDIQDNVSGYTLQPNDAGKLITNGGSVFRDLLVNTSLASPGNGFSIKGRVVLTPQLGVNIDLPNGTTITSPDTFVCASESYYVLQRKGYTGTNWILVEVKKSDNLATTDLTQTDFSRNYNFPNGNYSLRFIQNAFALMVLDAVAGSPTLLVGKNSNGAGLRVNKQSGSGNAFEVTGGTSDFDNNRLINVADPTDAQDASTKAYADTKNINVYDGTNVDPLTRRSKYRAVEYIEFVDDAIHEETKIQLRSDSITPAETTRFAENGAGNVDLKIAQNKIPTGDINGFATEYTASSECLLGLDSNSEILEFEAVEIYNILKEEGITANKTLALLDINGNSANVKAKFEISAIVVQNTTGNAVTINIGSTALGTDVVNGFALGANETKKLPLGTTFFSITSGQNLFISSGSWNSANLNIHVTISKIWQ